MKRLTVIGLAVLACLAVGFFGSMVQADALAVWYPTLNKSSLTPPDATFGIVWTILYVMMGVALGLVLTGPYERAKKPLFGLFLIQLVLNFCWSFLFFRMRSPAMGMVDIMLLWLVIIYWAYRAWPVNRISAWLFAPYIAWVTFAAYLNLYILMHN